MIGLWIYAAVIGLIYMVVQLKLRKSWLSLPEFKIPASFHPATNVVIIIPARNEASNIKSCLRSILDQDYPTSIMEIILVDDHSEDRTLEFARSFDDPRLKVVALEDLPFKDSLSPKKRALKIGIEMSKAELIITTDADCQVQNNWIKTIAAYFDNSSNDMIAGPVLFESGNAAFENFQALDFVGMMGITGAGIHSKLFHLCNGANLAFSRKSFLKVNGYEGTEQIASGDDILLAQKYVKDPDLSIGYLKSNDAVVRTKPMSTYNRFLKQRLRWGAKSEFYSEKSIIYIQFIVLITCLSLVAFISLGIIFYKWHWLKYLVATSILLLLKSIADFIALRTYAQFFHQLKLMKGFIFGQFAHINYIALVGCLSIFVRKHEWKGRTLK